MAAPVWDSMKAVSIKARVRPAATATTSMRPARGRGCVASLDIAETPEVLPGPRIDHWSGPGRIQVSQGEVPGIHQIPHHDERRRFEPDKIESLPRVRFQVIQLLHPIGCSNVFPALGARREEIPIPPLPIAPHRVAIVNLL